MSELIHYENEYYRISFSPYGAAIQKLETKDGLGQFENIIFTFKDEKKYLKNDKFAGSTMGPYTGRIYPPVVKQGAQTYRLNDTNKIHLHSENDNFAFQKFSYEMYEDHVVFDLNPVYKYYPSVNQIRIIYTFKKRGFSITYESFTDHDTYLNVTNHCYFNLGGSPISSIDTHQLKIPALKVSRLDKNTLPINYMDVKDTIFDFNQIKMLDHCLNKLKNSPQKGLDHCFLIDSNEPIILNHPTTKRVVKIKTDYSAVQIYTNNFPSQYDLENGEKDKIHHFICIEAQHPVNDLHDLHQAKSFQKENTIKRNTIEYEFLVEGVS